MVISTVFLDRDGVINEDKPPYLIRVEDVAIHKDVQEALRKLTDAGIRAIVVSNQGAIGRGLHSRENAERIFRKVIDGAEAGGGKIDAWYYCPHPPEEGCSCRKPRTGMFEQAVHEHGIRLEEAVFVGDGFGDALAAQTLGLPFYLVNQGWGPGTKVECDEKQVPYIPVANLGEAVNNILNNREGNNT
jgi:D-glycero-D-manno-heptose 1,7-bisphosphate phosphatase